MKLNTRLATASLAAGSLACTALALSTPATAAESVNIPAISSASFAEVERGGVAYFSSSKRTDYPDGFGNTSRASGVRPITTRRLGQGRHVVQLRIARRHLPRREPRRQRPAGPQRPGSQER